MRDVIMWNMVTMDVRFKGPNEEIDWFVFDDDLERYILETQKEADTLLFGRKTYEFMASYWPGAEGQIADFMNSVPKVVFSTTLDEASWNNTTLIKDNVPDEVSKLKQQSGGDIFLFGSADFAFTLMQHDLIDEYRIGINPLVLGSGSPLFKASPDRRPMTLLETRPLASGLVILHYRPVEKSA